MFQIFKFLIEESSPEFNLNLPTKKINFCIEIFKCAHKRIVRYFPKLIVTRIVLTRGSYFTKQWNLFLNKNLEYLDGKCLAKFNPHCSKVFICLFYFEKKDYLSVEQQLWDEHNRQKKRKMILNEIGPNARILQCKITTKLSCGEMVLW